MRCWVIVQAWKRPELTRRTVETFQEKNETSRIETRYALDGGYETETRDVLEAAGIAPVVVSEAHVGIAEMLSRITQKVLQISAKGDAVTVIQNDWESARPMPCAEITDLLMRGDIGWVRLFGRYKARGQREKTDERLFGCDESETAKWEGQVPATDAYIGRYLWGHPPVCAPVETAAFLARNCEDNREATRRSLLLDLKCAAYLDNPVFYHIGGGQSAREEMGGFV